MNVTAQLLKLFRVDEQIRSLTSRLDGAKRYYNEQKHQISALQTQRKQVHDEMMQASAAAGNFENEVRTIEARMDELRGRMSQSQTNKEYTAFLTELNTIKIDKEEFEAKALEHLTLADELEERMKEIDALLEERDRVLEVAAKDLADREAGIADRLTELQAERSEAEADVPSDVLREYSERLENYDGEAMAGIEEQDRRNMEYVCGECNMSIPVERFSSLLSTGVLTFCPSCQRILYVPDSLRESFDKRLAKR